MTTREPPEHPQHTTADDTGPTAALATARRHVELIDEQILLLVKQRSSTAAAIAAALQARGEPAQELTREGEVFDRYTAALGALGSDMAAALLRMPQGLTLRPTDSLLHACLGPPGTFTESAARTQLEPGSELLYQPSVADALASVRRKQATWATVPIENSLAGFVDATLDALAQGEPLTICSELVLPITLVLASRPDTRDLDDVQRVASHPHALAQAQPWLHSHLPEAVPVAAPSTAAAADALSTTTADYDAVLCSPQSATISGLRVLATDVLADRAAMTRFITVTQPGLTPPPSGHDRTHLTVFTPGRGSPWELGIVLTEFARQGVPVMSVEPRPLTSGFGSRYYHLDCHAHITQPGMRRALLTLRQHRIDLRYLGSYPAVDPSTANPDPP